MHAWAHSHAGKTLRACLFALSGEWGQTCDPEGAVINKSVKGLLNSRCIERKQPREEVITQKQNTAPTVSIPPLRIQTLFSTVRRCSLSVGARWRGLCFKAQISIFTATSLRTPNYLISLFVWLSLLSPNSNICTGWRLNESDYFHYEINKHLAVKSNNGRFENPRHFLRRSVSGMQHCVIDEYPLAAQINSL